MRRAFVRCVDRLPPRGSTLTPPTSTSTDRQSLLVEPRDGSAGGSYPASSASSITSLPHRGDFLNWRG